MCWVLLEYVTSITCTLFKHEISLKLANLMLESFKLTGRLVSNSQKFGTMRMFFLGGGVCVCVCGGGGGGGG